MLNNTVSQVLEDAGHFSNEFTISLESHLHAEIYRSKQIIHAAGQIETNLYIVESGFARSYYYDRKGTEHTVRFYTAGELIFSYEGYYKVPSFYYTEFMETSNTIVLSYSDLNDLQKKFLETSFLIKFALLKSRKEEYERQNILTLPANERYDRLLEQNHIIFQKSPAKFIASYLNMSRETLARLMGRH
ncbi:cAMP-binding domain of CRP or a regulatory subunit of cAMP-dependent protein kinases [Mucilaginibacter gossypiicola]|uniref:cAMP-binding domain of CRP or a regulatory subunit of cAMP-dependent protein kinases n=1 Tax=Mucilaginibacter gossypiicola TaxID=551995 RepID=A0A1H8D300_9SPHI|nr:Crp/Fnr family transcriptional regulator [Mucilaginibacter gossypiicola]SEN01555.1 cAMP-binding domain of CRP or a regulatory subunit of cAMP-dependent protein kinases [Mucilaginibacter gossypiicola]